jgi:hypothetical protein
MIYLKANDIKFQLPADWNDVTLNQAIALSKLNHENENYIHIKILSILSGLEEKICSNIHLEDFTKYILPVLQFINQTFNQDALMNQELPKHILSSSLNVNKIYSAGQMVWAQHLTFENISGNKSINDLQKIPKIIAICIQDPNKFNEEEINDIADKVLNLYLFDALAIAGYYLKIISEFYKRANLKSSDNYTSEQIRAGIKEFDKFGAFNSIDALAGGDITKWEEVVRLPMSDVVLKMKMNQQQYSYDKKYHEIINKKR